jgi:hypothetical protein
MIFHGPYNLGSFRDHFKDSFSDDFGVDMEIGNDSPNPQSAHVKKNVSCHRKAFDRDNGFWHAGEQPPKTSAFSRHQNKPPEPLRNIKHSGRLSETV